VRGPLTIPLGSLKQGENKLNFDLRPLDLDFHPREVAENPSFEFFTGPVLVRLSVTGSVAFRAKLQCALCACEFERSFEEPLSAEFVSYEDLDDDEALNGEDMDRGQLRGNWLDLLPMVRDAVHLAVPMAPECRPRCKGLCKSCGADLNKGPCECVRPRRRARAD
jgi:uncharacterized metal-binding protein YceD (DUF177 family)